MRTFKNKEKEKSNGFLKIYRPFCHTLAYVKQNINGSEIGQNYPTPIRKTETKIKTKTKNKPLIRPTRDLRMWPQTWQKYGRQSQS